MVVAGSESAKVAETVDSDNIFRCIVADRSSVARDLAIGDIVSSLGTKEEAVVAKHAVCGNGGSLNESRSASHNGRNSYPEHVGESMSVDTGLLVDSVEQDRFFSGLGCQRGRETEFQALGKIVVKLKLRLEDVGSGPGFGQDEAVLVVGVLGLNVTADALRLGVAQTRNLEGNGGDPMLGLVVDVVATTLEKGL